MKLFVYFIKIYQNTLGLILPASCRFEPTCSCYAIQALKKHGAIAGFFLTIRRIIRCNPWVAGGYDPVPEKLTNIFKVHERSGIHE
ncbi:membrane protein insertion efficiency factor YidD [candidate division WOR-3 bacterium RBG_13_43_14]|uniref:Putative membrane protein insertion efficiency factor n=1 Tax=candidate division WOR-3 bacterium RBG_13_43_14 TaxID=1802590 RepID=A0A1F4U9Q0_UNCW3|nr:MAG: membrane protein insertion efficiency factor YidD [candidate division WOR-3 bacterium RBG_13_43_14]